MASNSNQNQEEINAEVRIAAERQLRALKIDLQEAQFESKEKKLAVKYHRVKFFERQKVTRKIKQTEKLLKEADSKDRAKIERTLQELRLDLNYILVCVRVTNCMSLTISTFQNLKSTSLFFEKMMETTKFPQKSGIKSVKISEP